MPVPDHPYDRHIGRYGPRLAAGLIAIADLERGCRVLDVGCGTGQLTVRLAEAVGAEGVAAIDPSPSMVEACRSRVPGAEVRTGTAEELPYPDDLFDAALAQLVINLVADRDAALTEMVRVTRPGGRILASLWDDEQMPLLRSIWDAMRAVAPGAIEAIDERTRVGLADPAVLARWWERAGLAEVSLGAFEVAADYEGFEDLWSPLEDGVGQSGQAYRSLDPGQRAEARERARGELGSPDGGFELIATVRTVSGVVPA